MKLLKCFYRWDPVCVVLSKSKLSTNALFHFLLFVHICLLRLPTQVLRLVCFGLVLSFVLSVKTKAYKEATPRQFWPLTLTACYTVFSTNVLLNTSTTKSVCQPTITFRGRWILRDCEATFSLSLLLNSTAFLGIDCSM